MSITAADPAARGGPGRNPAGKPRPGLAEYAARVVRPAASLQLTVGLFVLSLLLVFFGTLAQTGAGIWTVIDTYFWSYGVKVDFQLLVRFAQTFDVFNVISPTASVPGWFPFIGGKLLAFLLAGNLLAAHLVRFKLTWKRAPVITLHAGLLLLFAGEYVTREYSVEQRMEIPEGGSASYAYDARNCELAFVDRTDPASDRVVVVPGKLLAAGGRITHPDLPADVQVVRYYKNAFLDDAQPGGDNPATAGFGRTARVIGRDEVAGVETQQGADFPAAYVTLLKKGTDEPIGTYLVSVFATRLPRPLTQTAEVGGVPYDLSLRFTRYYKPYTLSLKKFRFDRYVGTEVAKNYSSEVVLDDPERGVHEEVTIAMNEPLRYGGETFYQADFDHETEKATILQVVRNPGWTLPYVACVVVGVGMLWHFGLGLATFARRRTAQAGGRAAIAPKTPFEKVLPWAAVGLSVLLLGGAALSALGGGGGAFDLAAAGRLPVVEGGRVKPLDSVARVNLRVISNGESFADGGRSYPAMRWFLDTAAAAPADPGDLPDPGPAGKYRVFRIESDQVRKLLGLPAREGLRYSFDEVRGKAREFEAAVQKARAKPDKDRDIFDNKVLDLKRQTAAYMEVLLRAGPLVLPPADGKDWRSAADAEQAATRRVVEIIRAKFPNLRERKLTEAEQAEVLAAVSDARAEAARDDPAAGAWDELLAAYRKPDAAKFNKLVAEYRASRYPNLSGWDALRVEVEWFLNGWAPFWWCTLLYVLAFLLAVGGWVGMVARPTLGESLRRASFGVLVVTFAVHLTFLLARMYLMGRPLVFVTNLYSSAVFIGCAAVAACLVIERVFPVGLGNAVAAGLGVATGVLAHNLAVGSDTLGMLQAVLDTNPWLATHVTTITLGYAATYVAGAIAVGYVLAGVFTRGLDHPVRFGAKDLPMGRVVGMVLYGVICGATLLSFVGTVLGGIWADQSWGRFWGWDPKENGAVMIVTWNALILHARWAGLVKDRGVAVLALVGSMVTTWSYFGTNQLGVGLHSYGFSKTLKDGCALTWLVHLALIGLALAPPRYWKSTPNKAV
ncbi:MAG: cytochrome c biogenesis protein CcsA [Gemmataceae bacterium]|nr:cytochrome c biogenesis protein CcsA [Gemmataceae bacterium]